MNRITFICLLILLTFSSCGDTEVIPPEVIIIENFTKTFCSQDAFPDYPEDRSDPSICNTELCTKYFNVWEELVLERNNINQDFMDKHINIYRTSTNEWKKGASFRVCYELKIDWAIGYNCDSFIIKIDPENNHYPSLDLPRDTELTKDQVALAVDFRAFSSRLSKINNKTEIGYASLDIAMSELRKYSEVSTLCFKGIDLDKESGNLILEGVAQYENVENSCIFSELDLITKAKNTLDSPCFITFVK